MNWQILLAISVITYSVSVILQRILLKDQESDPIAYSIVFQIITGAIIGIYTLFSGIKLPPSFQPFILNFILMIFLYGVANIFIFKSLKLAEASSFTILFASRALWTIVGAIIFLGESFSSRQMGGTLLILASITTVSLNSGKIKFGKGEIYTLFAAGLFGLAFANDAFIIQNFDVPTYLTIAFIIPALAVFAANPKSATKMKPLLQKGTLIKMITLGFFYAISAITIFLAYQIGRNATQIAPLNQTATILTVILGIVFLRERALLGRKLLGALLSFLGVILLK